MKSRDFIRPDKILIKGLQSLTGLDLNLYADLKSEAKAKAELTFIGEKKLSEVKAQLYTYNESKYDRIDELNAHKELIKPQVATNYWLNYHGIHDVDLVSQIGESTKLDRLTIRRILDTTQRPKVEEYDNYLFFSIKSILKDEYGILKVEQLSFLLGRQFIVSFQEEEGDHFENIRNKMEEGIGFIRKRSIDYLLTQLLDAILDNYFETIEKLNEELPSIEKAIQDKPNKGQLIALENLKKSAQLIKKSLSPFKEALQNIENTDNEFVKGKNKKYFRDLLNSTIAAIEEIETTQATLDGLTNIYFAADSQKMNETMKVLTTVATIFIPLTFIAGIYGMNFEYMPELAYRHGYFVVWGVMSVVAILMLIYFRRKKWL